MYPGRKIPSSEVNQAFSLIKTKGSAQYEGVVGPFAKTNSDKLWELFQKLFYIVGDKVKGKA
jgi:hypothetical protein